MSPGSPGSSLEELRSSYRLVREPKMQRVLRLQAALGSAIREYLNAQGFVELLPPIIGPASDPGIRGAQQAVIAYQQANGLAADGVVGAKTASSINQALDVPTATSLAESFNGIVHVATFEEQLVEEEKIREERAGNLQLRAPARRLAPHQLVRRRRERVRERLDQGQLGFAAAVLQ